MTKENRYASSPGDQAAKDDGSPQDDTDEVYYRCTQCGFILDLRWKADGLPRPPRLKRGTG